MNTRYGAGGRTRTGTVSPPVDFESTTSANSITPAYASGAHLSITPLLIIHYLFSKRKRKNNFRHFFWLHGNILAMRHCCMVHILFGTHQLIQFLCSKPGFRDNVPAGSWETII